MGPFLRRLAVLAGLLAFLYGYVGIGRTTREKFVLPPAQEMQDAVKDAFVRSWAGYRKYAWGMDIYRPLSKSGDNIASRPMGWIVVDSLDTMMLMGLDEEVAEARDWIESELDYDLDQKVSVFETTIRMVGGLLSAYYLSEDEMYLRKARDLADRILPAFDTPSGIPTEEINLARGLNRIQAFHGVSSTAEVATLQLEFKYLSHVTGDEKYWLAVEQVMQVLEKNKLPGGLVPIFVSPQSGRYRSREIRLGSRGDSYYEYLLKQWIQTSQEEDVYRNMYDETVAGIKEHLVGYSKPNNLLFIGELPRGVGSELSSKMDHLVCFAGGMFAMGSTGGKTLEKAKENGWTALQEEDLRLGHELTRSCVETYLRTATGLGPEIVVFNTDKRSKQDFFIKRLDKHNLQRPETVESLFYLWQFTKDPIYREWGWKIFQAFEKHSKIKNDDAGYTCLSNVDQIDGERLDNMESFWLSETLKYFWLLFDDNDTWALDKVVFNTEAHPFPVIPLEFVTGWHRKYPYSP